MNLLRKYYDKDSIGGGMPDEVRAKIDHLCNLNQEPLYREGVFDGVNLASEELNLARQSTREYFKLFNEAMDKFMEQAQEISRLKEENERLRGEVDRIRKYILDVLIENHQAQIAGYYNDDKTDTEREKRNAVIEEYSDLIAIFKANIPPPPKSK